MDYGEPEDKQWARKYILDPLTAPEPSQETGPGSSFFNPRRSLSLNHHQKAKPPATLKSKSKRRLSGYPTPPQSASPTRSGLHPSNPFTPPKPQSRVPDRAPSLPAFDWAPAATVLARRRNSFDSSNSSNTPYPDTPKSPERFGTRSPERRSPERHSRRSQDRYPLRVPQKIAHLSPERRSPERTPLLRAPPKLAQPSPEPRSQRRNPLPVPEKPANYSPRRRSPESQPASPYAGRSVAVKYPPQTHYTRGSADQVDLGQVLYRSSSLGSGGLRRSNSITQRYPGDMSHRPLDMIKRDARAADKAPHLRRRNAPNTDTIDSLDKSAVGGAYHHGGPYDATLASRNANKFYSPVEALKDSNIEALKATPAEYIKDSLVKHVPLQGTATVAPGSTDMRGQVMEYEEGADLMREADAPGGAYKRYDFIPYHPDDLKGKGEPSYTVERDLKEQKKLRKHRSSVSGSAIELQERPRNSFSQPRSKGKGVIVRQRSASSAAASGRPGPSTFNGPMSPASATSPREQANGFSNSSDLHRSNTTGNRFTEGLKRRFGSLRRKNHHTDQP